MRPFFVENRSELLYRKTRSDRRTEITIDVRENVNRRTRVYGNVQRNFRERVFQSEYSVETAIAATVVVFSFVIEPVVIIVVPEPKVSADTPVPFETASEIVVLFIQSLQEEIMVPSAQAEFPCCFTKVVFDIQRSVIRKSAFDTDCCFVLLSERR